MIRHCHSFRSLDCCFALLALLATSIPKEGLADEASKVSHLKERLEHAKAVEDRFVVLKEIGKHATYGDAPSLIASISKCATDVDAGVRCAAVLDLAKICYEHKLECPSELVAALTDSNAEVRRAAYENITPEVYSSLPSNVGEIAATILSSKRYRDVRASAPTLLRYSDVDKKQKKKLLLDAMADRDFFVRNNAASALLALSVSPDSAIQFFAQNAFDECRREFYSTKLGWSPITSQEEMAVFRHHHIRILSDAATKHPESVLRVLSERLSPGDRDAAVKVLNEIAASQETGGDAASRRLPSEASKRLCVFANASDRQVASLAQAAIDQLTKTQSTFK